MVWLCKLYFNKPIIKKSYFFLNFNLLETAITYDEEMRNVFLKFNNSLPFQFR
jgi:hypothetical protein